MERNIELLEKTMRYIEDNPDKHDQSKWWCDTAGCFAGWALSLSGVSPRELENLRDQSLALAVNPYRSPVASRAMQVLGLTVGESRKMFDSDNTRDMLSLMVKDLVNGEKLRSLSEYQEGAE